MTWLAKLPLLLHAVIETAASLSFILVPHKQLPLPPSATSSSSAEARLLLRSYGGLLLSTNLLCFVFFFSPPDLNYASGLVSLCIASYHPFPVYRAYARIQHNIGMSSSSPSQKSFLGGPALHLVVHLILFVGLLASGYTLLNSS
ncbi:hypothetical protein QBC46DRAFT_371237 [Diplogelasinospora grovesii]|uniref:Uncharacterized protein n=1 Tax=Diplogelasinospora grovesii TaxID=303347 RepID=A0AAN6NH13_9PEZI|nr:hypothetical protein QBC46DRAFT_371237 [Diplogelasinospora grovesii]